MAVKSIESVARLHHSVARAQLLELLGAGRFGGVLCNKVPYCIALVSDDHDNAGGIKRSGLIKDIAQKGLVKQRRQNLGPLGITHALSLAGGKDDNGKGRCRRGLIGHDRGGICV